MQRGGVANFYLRKVISTPLFSHFEALSLLLLNGCTCSPVRGWMTRRLHARRFFPNSKGDDPPLTNCRCSERKRLDRVNENMCT